MVGRFGMGRRLVNEVGARFYRAVILGSGRLVIVRIRNTGVSLSRLIMPNVILGSRFIARGIRISLMGPRGYASATPPFLLDAIEYVSGPRVLYIGLILFNAGVRLMWPWVVGIVKCTLNSGGSWLPRLCLCFILLWVRLRRGLFTEIGSWPFVFRRGCMLLDPLLLDRVVRIIMV